ncbi:unnamed protein product, partial [Polarella glacialis]
AGGWPSARGFLLCCTRMGAACAACAACSEKPEQGVKEAPVTPCTKSSPSHTPHPAPEAEIFDSSKGGHVVRHRASLQVKDGGFAVANFYSTNTGKVEDFYELSKKRIGEGGFGSVQKGHKRMDRYFAVKSISKKLVDDMQKLHEEIEIMRLLDHPNIVRFQESFEDRRCLYIVLELCEGGELFDRIVQAGHLTEGHAASVVRDMLLAINYLHLNHIMHRDLKPENFLLSTVEEVGKSPLKMIDFGLASRFTPGVPARTKAGTPNYIAPEVLSGRYDEKVDIWSLGVLMYLLLSGTHPFTGKTVDQVLKKVTLGSFTTDGKAWRGVSSEAKAMVKACLLKTPMVRPTAAQALKNRWLEMFASGEDSGPITTLEVGGLMQFGRMNKLKKAVITVIATQLAEDRIEALKHMFLGMDSNGDGTLSIPEIKKGMEQAGVECPPDLIISFQEADTDGSGVVDYTEFLAATMGKKTYNQEDIVWSAFKKFDADDSGAIDKSELVKVLGNDDVQEAMHLKDGDRLDLVFQTVDANGDGVIDFEEFMSMMRGYTSGEGEGEGTEGKGGGLGKAKKGAKGGTKVKKAPK